MEAPAGLVFLFIALIFQLSDSATIVVDGVSKWRNPSVHVGDSIIFKHKYNHNLYVFPNERAFNLCNFARAVLLTKPDSTFTVKWDPSRSGFFYLTFSNGSLRGCREGEKLAIEVSLSPSENMAASPELSSVAAPSPTSGGIVSSSPAYSWPFKPRISTSPSTAPSAIPPATSPALLPEKGDGIPFINSNPAVPLPTGEVDSATIRPLPTSGHGGQVLGLFAVQMALSFVVSLLLL